MDMKLKNKNGPKTTKGMSNMDLLNENQYEKPKASKGKKMILILLILSVILVIAIIAVMIYVESNKVVGTTLYINEQPIEIGSDLVVTDNQEIQYISLKDLSELLGYEYDNSEYRKYSVDTTKCYIKNNKLISGFELGSKKMYKYEEGTNLDYQYYTLKYNIITYNNKLYIAMADIGTAINASCIINENKEIRINSMEYLTKKYQEQLKDRGYTVAADQNNQKALVYGWIIVNKNGVWSVLNTQFEEIIGAKYSSIYFDELNSNYIVSNTNGQYGIITNVGTIGQSLKYDDLEILNYENMLYKVKNNNKYGIMKSDGTMLANIIYDEIGYKADPANKILYTLIVPALDARSEKTIVVKQNGKYGLIYLANGEIFLQCDHLEKLYSVNELGQVYYKIEAEKRTMDLLEYLKLRNLIVIELN